MAHGYAAALNAAPACLAAAPHTKDEAAQRGHDSVWQYAVILVVHMRCVTQYVRVATVVLTVFVHAPVRFHDTSYNFQVKYSTILYIGFTAIN